MRLLLVLGPTASGKTAKAIELAREYHTEILSTDSRQFYREMDIGVARPSVEELQAALHHFIACRSVMEPYNVYTYAEEALTLIRDLSGKYDTLVAVGGSSLYIEALCHGIAPLPDPTPELREQLSNTSLPELRRMLQRLDPEHYAKVDLANPVRLRRALEVCITTGKRYSEVVVKSTESRPFTVEPVVLMPDREELRRRIGSRIEKMMAQGLEEEARRLYPLRHLTPLNTVGYKEFFALWEEVGATFPLSSEECRQVSEAIALNTWHYAKKQLTWLKKAVSV